MIFDLNVASVAKSLVQKKLLEEGTDGSQMADSESSNSSVFNAEDSSNISDEDEASIRPNFRFGILKNATVSEEEVEEIRVISESRLVTHQLFPQQPQGISEWHPSSRQNWVDFTDFHADVPAAEEVTLLHPQQQQLQVKKSRRGPRSRSSAYRGVTFYRRTGRWESHIWDCGKQVYLGGFDTAHDAARAYDRAAIKFRGLEADINFILSDYEEDLKQMRNLTKEEFVHMLRRQSTGLSRGSSKYSGVTRHKFGRWEARMGQLVGQKGHDKAAITCKGKEAVTNFQQHTYEGDLPKDDVEDFGHCIDLNLSISQPTVCNPKGNVNVVDQLLYYGSLEASDHVKQIPSFDLPCVPIVPAHPLALAPDHPKAWSNIYPGFFPVKEKAEAGLTAFKCCPTWKFHGFSPLPPYSCAASSGFSTVSSTIGNSYTQPAQLPPVTTPYLFQTCAQPPATGQHFPS